MSAATYYNLTTYRLDSVDVAIPRKAKISTMPDWPAFSVYYYADKRFELGIETVYEGKNHFKIYDIEKTVADIVFFREKIGIEETKEILVNYLKRKDRNINKLVKYAEMLKCDDALRFDLESLEVINITEFKEYSGVNVSIMGYLERTKVPVSIDIGFGDVIYPKRMKMKIPVLLDMEEPEFTEDPVRQRRWQAFINKKKAIMNIEFKEIIEQVKKLLMPGVKSIDNNVEFKLQWNSNTKKWMALK